jgi:hypothetical protein
VRIVGIFTFHGGYALHANGMHSHTPCLRPFGRDMTAGYWFGGHGCAADRAGWAEQWLRAEGTTTIRLDGTDAVVQDVPRRHRIGIGL